MTNAERILLLEIGHFLLHSLLCPMDVRVTNSEDLYKAIINVEREVK